jgi:hypothetical protein
MIHKREVDLSGRFQIEIPTCDCHVDFPGFSGERDRGVKNSVQRVMIGQQK